jgi:DDE superfamily endonuclease
MRCFSADYTGDIIATSEIAKRERKLFWIIDRHLVHQSQLVHQWLAEHIQQIEVFYLPSYLPFYSPQLNPVEYLNGDVKQGVHSKSPSRNLSQLKGRVLADAASENLCGYRSFGLF